MTVPDTPLHTAPGKGLQLSLPDTRDAVEICRLEVRRYLEQAGLSEQAQFRAEVVQEECLMNIIWHAFDNDAEHSITVHVHADPGAGEVSFRFEDSGKPFDPTQAVDPQLPSSLSDAVPGGLGLMLVRKFASRLDYTRDGGRNQLTVTLPLG